MYPAVHSDIESKIATIPYHLVSSPGDLGMVNPSCASRPNSPRIFFNPPRSPVMKAAAWATLLSNYLWSQNVTLLLSCKGAEWGKAVAPGSPTPALEGAKDGAPEILIVEGRSKRAEGSATRPWGIRFPNHQFDCSYLLPKYCVSSIATHPCKQRKDGQPQFQWPSRHPFCPELFGYPVPVL